MIFLHSPIHNILLCDDEKVYLTCEYSIIELKLGPKHPLCFSAPYIITSIDFDSSNIFITMINGIVFIFNISTGCVVNFICIHSSYGSIRKVIPLLRFGRILVQTCRGRIIIGDTNEFPISICHVFKGIVIYDSRIQSSVTSRNRHYAITTIGNCTTIPALVITQN